MKRQSAICTLVTLLLILPLSTELIHAQLTELTVETVAELHIDEFDTNTVEWSPNGSLLAVGGGNGILLFNEDFSLVASFAEDIGEVFSVSWSPNNNQIAAISQENSDTGAFIRTHIFILDTITAEITDLEAERGPVTPIEWSPLGQFIAVGQFQRRVVMYDVQTEQIVFTFSLEEDNTDVISNLPRTICWAEDDTLMFVLYEFESYFLEIPSGEIVQQASGVSRDQADCDTDLNVVVRADGKVWRLDTNEIIAMEEHNIDAVAVALSPDDRYFAINRGDYVVQIWTWGGNTHLVAEMEGGIYSDEHFMFYYDDSIAWHPDGELLAAVGEDNIVRIWRVEESP